MIVTSKGNVRQDLLDKFKETKNRDYLEEWKKTEAPVVYSMRLANMIIKEKPYLYDLLGGQDSKKYGTSLEVINPDLLSYTYLMIGHMIDKWDPDRASLNTYIYGFVKMNTVREIYKDINKSSAGNDEYSLDLLEEQGREYSNTSPQERHVKYLTEKLMETVGDWAREEDIYILKQELGEITTQEAIQKMGYKYRTSFYKRKKLVYDKAREYLEKENYL